MRQHRPIAQDGFEWSRPSLYPNLGNLLDPTSYLNLRGGEGQHGSEVQAAVRAAARFRTAAAS